ncbi:hypothetical protein BGZ63DRAFT_375377 [Mariannaea sp. PMI_226]|nr:hypothetical protein BGZ63DRAFT_375377 [Mariannaea sp. PMI_226]
MLPTQGYLATYLPAYLLQGYSILGSFPPSYLPRYESKLGTGKLNPARFVGVYSILPTCSLEPRLPYRILLFLAVL